MQTVYELIRKKGTVRVRRWRLGIASELSAEPLLTFLHKGVSFDWGPRSETAGMHLAFCLIKDATGSISEALAHHQEFCQTILTRQAADSWVLTRAQIVSSIEAFRQVQGVAFRVA